MTPRWVGVRRGATSIVLDRETGVRVTVTASPRRRGVGWKDRLWLSSFLALGLACCVLYPKMVAMAWATLGAIILLACLVDAIGLGAKRAGIWMRTRA